MPETQFRAPGGGTGGACSRLSVTRSSYRYRQRDPTLSDGVSRRWRYRYDDAERCITGLPQQATQPEAVRDPSQRTDERVQPARQPADHQMRSQFDVAAGTAGVLPQSPEGSTTNTCSVRGPWTPSTRWSSMSDVAEGPLIQVSGRVGLSRASAAGTPSTMSSTDTMQMCLSGTRVRARRPLVALPSRTIVPVSAMATADPVTTASRLWRASMSSSAPGCSVTTSIPVD